jgi:hypothetical protein
MSNSSLVAYTKLSPNQSGKRKYSITRISIHCVVGQCSVETLGSIFASESREASCNYGIGSDGRVGLYVDEANRSWCTSSADNDNRAVTIEVASDTTSPYKVNDKAYSALLNLVTDICQRNGKTKVTWLGDKAKTLAYTPASDEIVLTVHRWFANKSCPGDYLYNLHPTIAAEVTKRLGSSATTGSTSTGTSTDTALQAGTVLTLDGVSVYKTSTATEASGTKSGTYYVWSADQIKGRIRITNAADRVGVSGQITGWISVADAQAAASGSTASTSTQAFTPYTVTVTASVLNVRKGPGTNYGIATTIKKGGVYTIVDEQGGWGKLKSGAGWIYLEYTNKR